MLIATDRKSQKGGAPFSFFTPVVRAKLSIFRVQNGQPKLNEKLTKTPQILSFNTKCGASLATR